MGTYRTQGHSSSGGGCQGLHWEIAKTAQLLSFYSCPCCSGTAGRVVKAQWTPRQPPARRRGGTRRKCARPQRCWAATSARCSRWRARSRSAGAFPPPSACRPVVAHAAAAVGVGLVACTACDVTPEQQRHVHPRPVGGQLEAAAWAVQHSSPAHLGPFTSSLLCRAAAWAVQHLHGLSICSCPLSRVILDCR